MRPVLFELGPLSPWAVPVIAAIMAAFLGLWSWVERREEPARPWTLADRLLWVGGVVLSTALLYWLINFHYAQTGQPVQIRSYGAMLLVGLLAGMIWLGHSGRPDGFKATTVVDLALYLLVGGILGARLIFVLLDLSSFTAHPASIFRVWEGGLSFHGGVLGGLIGAYIFARGHHLSFGRIVDLASPSLALGYAFTRIGCFLNGCCFGGYCSNALGVRFGPGSEAAAWALKLPPGQVATTAGPPLYPTQLFSSVMGFLIFFALLWAAPLFRKRGHLFIFTLVLFGLERFIVEFWRAGASGKPFPLFPPLTEAQVFSLVLMVAAGAYLIINWPRAGAEPTPLPPSRGQEGGSETADQGRRKSKKGGKQR